MTIRQQPWSPLQVQRLVGVAAPVAHAILDLARAAWEEQKVRLTIAYGFRSDMEQQQLYLMSRNGRDDDGDGLIDEADEWRTNAQAGQSPHQHMCAADVYGLVGRAFVTSPEFWRLRQRIAAQHAAHVVWGGNWKGRACDPPHWELRNWHQVRLGQQKIIPFALH